VGAIGPNVLQKKDEPILQAFEFYEREKTYRMINDQKRDQYIHTDLFIKTNDSLNKTECSHVYVHKKKSFGLLISTKEVPRTDFIKYGHNCGQVDDGPFPNMIRRNYSRGELVLQLERRTAIVNMGRYSTPRQCINA